MDSEQLVGNGEETMTPEEKRIALRRLRDAVKSYNLYKDREGDPDSDTLKFPEFCDIFYGIQKKVANKFWTKGEI